MRYEYVEFFSRVLGSDYCSGFFGTAYTTKIVEEAFCQCRKQGDDVFLGDDHFGNRSGHGAGTQRVGVGLAGGDYNHWMVDINKGSGPVVVAKTNEKKVGENEKLAMETGIWVSTFGRFDAHLFGNCCVEAGFDIVSGWRGLVFLFVKARLEL